MRTGHHKLALLTIAVAFALDVGCGFAYAAAEHVSNAHGLYCALGNAMTDGPCSSPVTSTGYLINAAEYLLVVPLFAATLSLFTSALTSVHVHEAKVDIKRHVGDELRKHLGKSSATTKGPVGRPARSEGRDVV